MCSMGCCVRSKVLRHMIKKAVGDGFISVKDGVVAMGPTTFFLPAQ